MKTSKPRMTLAQYLQCTNLRRKVQSLSKSKDKFKDKLPHNSLDQDKKIIDFLAIQHNRKIKTEYQKNTQDLKLLCRQVILKDTDYIKVLRLIQNLSSIFQHEMEQFRKNNSFLKSYLLQASFINQVQHKKTINKASKHYNLSEQKQLFTNPDFKDLLTVQKEFQQKQLNQNYLKIDVISQCPRLSLMSKFDQNKSKNNEISIQNKVNSVNSLNQTKSINQNKNSSNIQPPKINIKLVQKNIKQTENFLFRECSSNEFQGNKDQEKYNPQHSTNQQSQQFINNINIQSPTKKSVFWDQNYNHKIASVDKQESVRQMMSLHTPSTFYKNSQRLQKNVRRYEFSDRQNSVSIRRYEHYKRNKHNQVNKSTAINSKTSIKQYK